MINLEKRIVRKMKEEEYDGIKKFYAMLKKYQYQHPSFNADGIIIRLYPELGVKKKKHNKNK